MQIRNSASKKHVGESSHCPVPDGVVETRVHRTKTRHAAPVDNFSSTEEKGGHETRNIVYVVLGVGIKNEHMRTGSGSDTGTHRGAFSAVRRMVY